MHTEPRGGIPISLVVIHTNEGPEGNRSAQGLASWLKANGPDGPGYHKVGDNAECITLAADDQVCYATGGVNHRSVSYCCVGYAAQTDAQWHDAYSSSELKIAATQVAVWCLKYKIPVRRLSPAQVSAGSLGICGHVDVTDPASEGHTDPGPNFPWTEFLALVAKAVEPPVAVHPEIVPAFPAVATAECPSGGAWMLAEHGTVKTIGKAPYRSDAHADGAADKHGGAARIEPHRYRSGLMWRWGYRITFADGQAKNYQ